MPDRLDNFWPDNTADHEANEIRRPHQTNGGTAEPFQLRADRQQCHHKAIAQEHDCGSQQDCPNGSILRIHSAPRHCFRRGRLDRANQKDDHKDDLYHNGGVKGD